ncbi:hypothetical protein MLD38_039615 [Melastoma candidum]|uniref:Uncharacterized protein n=1 Tax=Melastoma candidum TaxID=119954 RepID=A0ACB9L3S7_9MYRT|nr:hypothetical protein MLD38_039615 [Melastoma candidum]
MSQEQPQRPEELRPDDRGGQPIKMPAMMQTAEARVFGQTQKGGPAAAMQAAATRNERAGFVGHGDVTDIAGDQGIAITEAELPGMRMVTEFVAGQVVGQFVEPTPAERNVNITAAGIQGSITIGEALEAAGHTRGGKAVDQSDASAIQAAEVRATGTSVVAPGGLASTAQSAAAHNETVDGDEDKIKLGEVLKDATSRLPVDKVATREDAEGIASAEVRNDPEQVIEPGGVAASVAVAVRLNEGLWGGGS